MNAARIHKMRSLFFIETFEVRQMLEVIGI